MVVRSKSSEVKIAPIRQKFVEIINELKEKEEPYYEVELFSPENKHMFNPIAQLKRMRA